MDQNQNSPEPPVEDMFSDSNIQDMQNKLNTEDTHNQHFIHPASPPPDPMQYFQPKIIHPQPAQQMDSAVQPSSQNLAGSEAQPISTPQMVVPDQLQAAPLPQPIPKQFFETEDPTNSQDNNDVAKIYAVISLVLALISPLAGFILAIIAYKKAKQTNTKVSLARISLLINILLMIFAVGFLVFLFAPTGTDTVDTSSSVDTTTTEEVQPE